MNKTIIDIHIRKYKYMCTFTLCGEYKLTANAKVLAEVRTLLIVGP